MIYEWHTFTSTCQEAVVDPPIGGGDAIVALGHPLVAT